MMELNDRQLDNILPLKLFLIGHKMVHPIISLNIIPSHSSLFVMPCHHYLSEQTHTDVSKHCFE